MGMVPLVTITTDFGLADGYVGAMKGVILSIAPEVRLVDISHEVAPQDVRCAAYLLYTAYRFFPPGTVHLVVVDPGVGSSRRPVALRTRSGCFVGPDNGVFSYVVAREPIEALVQLSDPRYRLPQVSPTFHGRDVFAPAAAHLAAGVPMAELGPPVPNPVTFQPPHLEVTRDAVAGEVMHADRFGNVITSIGRLLWSGDELSFGPPAWVAEDGRGGVKTVEQRVGRDRAVRFKAAEATVRVAGERLVGIWRTYAEGTPGEPLAIVGSDGHLEIAVREGSATQSLRLRPGDRVVVRW